MQAIRREPSLRTRFLLIVVGAALLPLATLGLWLIFRVPQSAERLLRGRLDAALDSVALDGGSRWVRVRSALSVIAEDERLRQLLPTGANGPIPDLAFPALASAPEPWRSSVERVEVRDAAGRPSFRLAFAGDTTMPYLIPITVADQATAVPNDVFFVDIPVVAAGSSRQLGTVHAGLRTGGVFSDRAADAAALGGVIAIQSRAGSTWLSPVPFDPHLLEASRFRWEGDEWMTSTRRLEDPQGITLVAAAPLSRFTAPFVDAARVGVWVLVAMTAAAFVVALLLTRRLTRSLERLARAADAVSRGDLDQRIGGQSRDEVGRVAQAFDGMTESLRRTLRQLSERQAIAAVGEFASTLAHEVRNPLGAMRLNLQSMEERIGNDPHLRSQMRQALGDVERLEATVAGSLQVARSGRVRLERIDVLVPLELALRNARPEFAHRNAILDQVDNQAISTTIQGDSAALERLFLNLLLNAAQALGPGQHAGVIVEVRDKLLVISVWDGGPGIPADIRERIFEPFYSTKAEGTGLGLSIARQIVAAHGGELQIESEVGHGTTVRVILTLAM